MTYEFNCSDISLSKWNELMKGARPINYQWLIKKIRKHLPELYQELLLDFYNPYQHQCKSTNTHYVLVHSSIEYFIRKH